MYGRRHSEKVLVAGWFSFENGAATAGDLLARDLACEWLERAGLAYDVALAAPFCGGVDWRSVDPDAYSHVVIVCGPFVRGERITGLANRFSGRRLVGLNLTMAEPLEAWNPFDLLLERDSPENSRPDITFLASSERVPIVGVALLDRQSEDKGERAMYRTANAAIRRLAKMRETAAVTIDTRLDANRTGLRSPAEVASLIANMDVVLTTRLHGMVLALRNGVPAVAVDAIAGGSKVKRQADAVGWPVVFTADALGDEELNEAFDYCLTEAARAKARECCARAREKVEEAGNEFVRALAAQVTSFQEPREGV